MCKCRNLNDLEKEKYARELSDLKQNHTE